VKIGIRHEDKNLWERRVPLIPEHVRRLVETGIACVVQRSPTRVFPDRLYRDAGAALVDKLDDADPIFAVKEIPIARIEQNKTYIFFSHTIKGQAYNIPLLQRLLDLKCTLIDYECIRDAKGKRLVSFGRHAGLAGMIDTLWAFGRRLSKRGVPTCFEELRPAHRYADLEAAKNAIRRVGDRIREEGLPKAIAPVICGFVGYGKTSEGAQEIFDLLPHETIAPENVTALVRRSSLDRNKLYKTVYRKQHTVARIADGGFDVEDYSRNPETYESRLERAIVDLSIVVNGVYWEEPQPRLVTRDALRAAWMSSLAPRLEVIGDVSCDIGGSFESTIKSTTPDDPVYVYDPESGQAVAGWSGHGPLVLAVDNLPCEVPLESSTDFSEALFPFVRDIAAMDKHLPFEQVSLPPAIRGATIVYRGALTPEYHYLEDHLRKNGRT